MTVKEAQNWFLRRSSICLDDKCSQAESVAIKALDKQIPQRPTYEGDGYDDTGNLIYDTWYCPCCDHSYEVDYDDYDFCPNCGQAIDWSVSE